MYYPKKNCNLSFFIGLFFTAIKWYWANLNDSFLYNNDEILYFDYLTAWTYKTEKWKSLSSTFSSYWYSQVHLIEFFIYKKFYEKRFLLDKVLYKEKTIL